MKFAIIRRNGLGDFVSATVPLCHYIKEKYPGAELHLFLSEQNCGLGKYFFPSDHVYTIPRGNKYLATAWTALRNRALAPDIGIAPIPLYPKLNNLFLFLLGAKTRYGSRSGKKIFDKLLTHQRGGGSATPHKLNMSLCRQSNCSTEMSKNWRRGGIQKLIRTSLKIFH